MNPKLIIITGSTRGEVFALNTLETTIGREAKNVVCINDASVSRQHCVIKQTGESHFVIKDLDSFNGTFVNGAQVEEKALTDKDQIAVGDIIILFLLNGSEQEALNSLLWLEENFNAQSTIRLERKDAIYLQPENLLEEFSKTTRVAKDLSTLLKISRVISSSREFEMLQKELLELIAEVIPAERSAIILAGEQREIVSTYGWHKNNNGNERNVPASLTVVNQCLKEGVALLCNCIRDDESLSHVQSLTSAKVHSVLCVPINAFEKTLGAIYLDTSDTQTLFDKDHLQLLTGIAGVAANPLENSLRIEKLSQETNRLLEQINQNYQMIGNSPRMQKVYSLIARVAPTDSTVLIRGESGTGKELAARAIHQNSHRANKPCVAINCATLSETLLESELFGHEKGAFTGALTQKKGKIEIANGGTLFLDEVGELVPSLQAKLLRVLQEREFERVGGTRVLKADVRVIAATNLNLEQAISEGKFRADLYYRLNVVCFTMPPLRERREDISLLTNHLVNKYNERCKRKIKGLSREARDSLQSYSWHGNVRELENAIERAVVLSQTDLITLEDLPETLIENMAASVQTSLPYQDAVNEAKRRIICDAIEKANGNIIEAAKQLGIHPNNLHRLIRTLRLKELTEIKK